MEKILELKNLKKHYPVLGGVFRRQINAVKALDGIDLDIYRGELKPTRNILHFFALEDIFGNRKSLSSYVEQGL